MLVLLCAMAHAARVDVAQVDAMIASVRPELESITGFTLDDVPKAHIATREALVVRVGGVYAGRIRAYRALAEGEGGKIRARAEREVSRALALYMPDDGDIYLNGDAVEQAFSDAEASATLLEPVVRCVIAHELTHALQDQLAATFVTADDGVLVRAQYLREGQAMAIERKLCHDEHARDFLEALSSVDVLPSRAPDDLTVPYGFSRIFVETLEERGGKNAVWGALQIAPVSDADIVSVARSRLVPGWNDPAALSAILAPYRPGLGWSMDEGAFAPMQLFPQLMEQKIGEVQGARAEAGLKTWAERDGSRVAGFVFLLEDDADAARWVRQRKNAVAGLETGGRILTLSTTHVVPGDLKPLRMKQLDGIAFELGSYSEGWAHRGRVLAGVSMSGPHMSRREMESALTAMLDAFPDASAPATLSSDAIAIVDRVIAEGAALGNDHGWQAAYNQAFYRLAVADFQGCIDRLADPPASDVGRKRTTELALHCAFGAEDDRVASRWVKEAGGIGALSPDSAFLYAELLRNANRFAEIEPLLPILRETGREPDSVTILELMVAVYLKHWSEVKTLVDLPAIDPYARAWAASAMVHAGRFAEARAIFVATCPRLEGEHRAQCEDAVRRLSR
jgi:hypothetical protein